MKVEQSRLDIVTDELCVALRLDGLNLTPLQATWLLRAIADVESSYGANSNPRHETAYCRGGRYHNAGLTKSHGCAAHCSYGPWQVMYPTAVELGFVGEPAELANPETNCLYAVRYLNARAKSAETIEHVARAYNGGNIHAIVPQSYIDKLTTAYERRSR